MGAVCEEDEGGEGVAEDELANAAQREQNTAEEDAGRRRCGCKSAAGATPSHCLESAANAVYLVA